MKGKAFYAYPDGMPAIRDAITGAVSKTSGSIITWKTLQTVGFKIDNLIREKIVEADVLIADITYPNHNVFYEIGFAIANEKPVIPTLNNGIRNSALRVQEIGLFDTTGWAGYTNAEDLHACLEKWPEYAWTNKYVKQRDYNQPLFILDSLIKTDFRNHIFHAVDNAHLQYRSFDPAEVPRLTAAQAISDISASAGAILPIISTEIVDADVHNLRAAFMLGLCHGFDVEALAIQYENGPAPLDYRDFITNSTFRRETESHVADFATNILVRNQQPARRESDAGLSVLTQIDLGSPMAENETQRLPIYFVATAEFARASRAEGGVVIGRKGSGKSAIHFQIVADRSRDKRNCVVDLRPASHNLSEMREALLSVVQVGVFDHTIAAFWQFVIYFEIALRLREFALRKAKNNFDLQNKIRAFEERFNLTEAVVAGDFTSRLDSAVRDVVSAAQRFNSVDAFRKSLTNAMFESPIPDLKKFVVDMASDIEEVSILIDDLDKGWPPRQVEQHDVSTIKHLIESLNKIQRELKREGIPCSHLVFVRSDIYEKLVDETADRGKYNVIKVDWSDPEQLKHMLRQRVFANMPISLGEEAWEALAPSTNSDSSIDRLIDASLRRPRFLIDICERMIAFAVNRGHAFVTEDDVDAALRQMSLYLVSDFGYEMRDVAGTPKDIFYRFIGKPEILSVPDIENALAGLEMNLSNEEIISLLLWYGFLGVADEGKKPVFIYDVAYDIRRLEGEQRPVVSERVYAVNPAFMRGLEKAA